ncbi:winged helix-turn-helix transcriptional regulator [Roseibium limicola]|uniref:Helix-turn-helix transcriptional regulator n=1 Tax=Roseibium limicola TaxID=2816037 RepID=A0A939ELR3_9HYPH|nr:helix-turn-helix domain-containing protein [Roseibium limicola]MBO0344475.1 helix-turn-helix transcriptional regulator [Roseibium limicola]
MAKVRHSRFDCTPGCAVEAAVALIDGKWKCVVLWHLLEEDVLRFNEIRRRIPSVTQRMLTNQLRELEEDGLIHREVYPQVPPKVEYSLTDMGRGLFPILRALKDWGDEHLNMFGQNGEAGKPTKDQPLSTEQESTPLAV